MVKAMPKHRVRFLSAFCAGLVCLCLILPPLDGFARAGGGSSMGSRGSRTYSPSPSSAYTPAPIQRSITPQAQPMNPQPGNPYAPQPFTNNNHPFLSGLAGGFLGGGLASMLFGHNNGYGDGYGGGGGGGLLQLLLLGGLAWFGWRWFKSRSNAPTPYNSEPDMMNASMSNQPVSLNPWGQPQSLPAQQPGGQPLAISQGDTQEFQSLLEKIQHSWGQSDIGQLRHYLTPEMAHYFSETLAANTSRGQVNKIDQVEFINGTPLESWSEGELEYATLAMKWRAIDYMAQLESPGTVVSGNATTPVEQEEIWTFVRAKPGAGTPAPAHWLLSAIQQKA